VLSARRNFESIAAFDVCDAERDATREVCVVQLRWSRYFERPGTCQTCIMPNEQQTQDAGKRGYLIRDRSKEGALVIVDVILEGCEISDRDV